MFSFPQEDMDYEINSRFDYLSEAYGAEIRSLQKQARYELELDRVDQQALFWLTEQGGLVEMQECDQDFHASTFYRLEARGQ